MSNVIDLTPELSSNCEALIATFPQSYIQSAHFDANRIRKLTAILAQYCQCTDETNACLHEHTKLSHSQILLSLGLVGLDCLQFLPELLCVHESLMRAKLISPTQLQIQLFVPDINPLVLDRVFKQMNSELEDSKASITLEKYTQKFTQQLLSHSIPRQRLHISDNCIIDMHIGDTNIRLNDIIPQPTALIDFWCIAPPTEHRWNTHTFWQMARMSKRLYSPCYSTKKWSESLRELATEAGFEPLNLFGENTPQSNKDSLIHEKNIESNQQQRIDEQFENSHNAILKSTQKHSQKDAQMLSQERSMLCQSIIQPYRYCHPSAADITPSNDPIHGSLNVKPRSIAIIGGGIASASLMLSLAERNQSISLFCRDSGFAKAASGNKQGALYPLLTPDNGPLSQFYQQAYLYSRQRILNLTSSGKQVSHDFCGVLQTGHDARSSARLNKISSGQNWPRDIMHRVDAAQANQLAGVKINQPGLFYPLGGWVCPHEFTQAAVAQAKQLSTPEIHFNTEIKKVFQQDGEWYLSTVPETETEVDTQTLFGPFSEIVLANGQGFNQFEQTRKLAATAFRGQVSHIPTTATLNQISTVLCAQGYMTPQHNSIHCIGASYVKNATSLSHCRQEQNDNQAKIASCYPETNWIKEIDISGQDSKVGVRMVTRDHAPMVGLAPDVERIYSLYRQRLSKDNQSKQTAIQQWKQCHAPVIEGLYVLGGLGSRGICSAPFAAEILAAQICGDIIPTNYNTLALLNPNRMWLRKLLKGKDI